MITNDRQQGWRLPPQQPRPNRGRSTVIHKYVIKADGEDLWVLRQFGYDVTLASGPDVVAVREQAFSRLWSFAPCSLIVMGARREEWQLESGMDRWEQVEA